MLRLSAANWGPTGAVFPHTMQLMTVAVLGNPRSLPRLAMPPPAMEALRMELGRSVKDPLVVDILRASKKGENEVRDAVRAAVGDLCAGALEGEAEPEDGPDDR